MLITGSGRFFSVGGDLRSLGADRDGVRPFIKSATIGLHAAISRMSRMDAPVVLAVHGLAAGGAVPAVVLPDPRHGRTARVAARLIHPFCGEALPFEAVAYLLLAVFTFAVYRRPGSRLARAHV